MSGAAVAGVMNSKTGNKENPALGNVFFGLQCFFGSMFFLLQKSVLDRYPPLQTTAWGTRDAVTLLLHRCALLYAWLSAPRIMWMRICCVLTSPSSMPALRVHQVTAWAAS